MIKQVQTVEYPTFQDYYYVVDGTSYLFKREEENKTTIYENVNEKLINVLECCRKNDTRIRVWYGANSKIWLEEYDVMSRIGRTTGRIKVPILVYNKRSFGGSELLVPRIVRIDDIEEKKTVYKLDGYEMPEFKIRETKIDGYSIGFQVELLDGSVPAFFDSFEKAQNWVDFMVGKRYKK